jgi:hypothetical protein
MICTNIEEQTNQVGTPLIPAYISTNLYEDIMKYHVHTWPVTILIPGNNQPCMQYQHRTNMKVFEKHTYQRFPIIGKKIPILSQSNTFECRWSANYGAILSAGSLVHKLSNKRPNLFTLIKTSHPNLCWNSQNRMKAFRKHTCRQKNKTEKIAAQPRRSHMFFSQHTHFKGGDICYHIILQFQDWLNSKLIGRPFTSLTHYSITLHKLNSFWFCWIFWKQFSTFHQKFKKSSQNIRRALECS